MLNRWINRLVRSEDRRRKLLRKPRISWPSLLQTGTCGKIKLLCRTSFPERIQINIDLKPTLAASKDITARVSLDNHTCLPTSIYQNLKNDRQRLYGRCAAIELVIKNWHAVGDKLHGIELCEFKNKVLYTKEYFTCTTSITDIQTIVNHVPVNAETKQKHIYPYGGFLSSDGVLGDTLYMTLSSGVSETKINIHSYQDLLDQKINLFDIDSNYALQSIDASNRHKVLPLRSLIEHGDIQCELTTQLESDTWNQSYCSESFVQKDGVLEGVLTLRRKGKPNLRRFS